MNKTLLTIFFSLVQLKYGCYGDTLNKTAVNGSYVIERELLKGIFSVYNADVIPRLEEGGASAVMFNFHLLSLRSFDVKEQVLKVFGIVSLEWRDQQLVWEHLEEFKTIRAISVQNDKIWTPDVVLYNTAKKESKSHLDLYKTRPIVFSTGFLYWRIPVTWEVSCTSDITWFPMDKQVCKLYFGSWTYDVAMLQLLLAAEFYNDTESKVPNEIFKVDSGEWLITAFNAEKTNITFDPELEPYSSITYEIKVERMALYYFLYIIGPLIALAFMFLFVFHIPYDSGERTGFGVTVLLSITVYLLVISEKLPEKSNNNPYLGICFVFVFFLLSMALFLSIFTMHAPKFKTKPPRLLICFLNFGCSQTSKYNGSHGSKDHSSIHQSRNKDELNNGFQEEASNGLAKPIDEERSVGINAFQHSDDDDKNTHQELWKKISRKIEIWFFFIFALLLAAVPCIILLAIKLFE